MKHTVRFMTIMAAFALLILAFAAVGCSSKDADTSATSTTPTQAEPTAATTGTASSANAEAETILVGSCTDCHDASRIYLQPAGTDWTALVTRMETAHGAKITAEEKAKLIDFLASRQQSDTEKTISGKCSTCHDLTKLYAQPAGTNWESVTAKMMDVHGLVLTEAEQQAVIDYLTNSGK